MNTKLSIKVTSQTTSETGLFFTAFKAGSKKELLLKGLPKSLAEKAKEIFEKGYNSDTSEIFTLRAADIEGYKNIVFCGLGDISTLTPESIRRAAGTLARDLNLKTKSVDVAFENFTSFHKDKQAFVEAFAEGSLLGAYKFDILKSKKKDQKKEAVQIHLVCKTTSETNATQKTVQRAVAVSECINFARYLGDMPSNLMTPTILASETVKTAKNTSLKVTIWDKNRCEKEGMGNFLNVAKGSNEPCKFIIMEYKGAGAKEAPICFVGKGLTFDSGGVSIKPSASMEEMKYDMCGGANVIATMIALAKLKTKVNAIAFVPASENMQNGWANKPGDVTTARNGKTTEVNNTDAEGRLILSDALVYATERKPRFIVDAATLTGAMVMALGDVHTGYFTNNEKLNDTIKAAAEKSGEMLWQLPLTKEHVEDMKGVYADLSNTGASKGAGSAKGAAYLSEFVGSDIPWAHFDIAGTAWNVGRIPYNPKKGATGIAIRTFIALAETW